MRKWIALLLAHLLIYSHAMAGVHIVNISFIVDSEAPSSAYAVGDLFSERFTATGWDVTYDATTDVATNSVDPDSTTITDTGFEGTHLDISTSSTGTYQKHIDMGSTYSDTEGRFFVRVDSESMGSTETAPMVCLDPTAGSYCDALNNYGYAFGIYDGSGDLYIAVEVSGANDNLVGYNTYPIELDTTYKVEWGASNDENYFIWYVDNTPIGRHLALTGLVSVDDVTVGQSSTNAISSYIDTIDIANEVADLDVDTEFPAVLGDDCADRTHGTLGVYQNWERTGTDWGETWGLNDQGCSGCIDDEDYTTLALRGNESLFMSDGDTAQLKYIGPFTDIAEFWTFHLWRNVTDDVNDGAMRWGVSDSVGGAVVYVHQDADGTLTVTLNTVEYDGSKVFVEDTTYWIWQHYDDAGDYQLWWNTGPDFDTATLDINTTTHTEADDGAYLWVANSSDDHEVLYDQIILSSAAIGDVCP